jgi:hypothetical protein
MEANPGWKKQEAKTKMDLEQQALGGQTKKGQSDFK